ncbi:MAG TPA: DNA polymerase III subunit beta [Bacillota bacterium]
MRIRVEPTPFASALQAVNRAVSSRTTLPVLTGILLEAGRDGVVLSGTDLEIAIRARVAADIVEPGAIVLPARYLSDFTRRIPYGTIELSVEPGTQIATFRWQRSEYRIHGIDPQQFPEPPQPGDETTSFPRSLLREIVQQTAFCVSQDETRPALTGVHLRCDHNGLIAIATDGFRVAIRRAPFTLAGDRLLDLIVPGRALQEVTRLLTGDGQAAAVLSSRENQIFLDLGDVQFASRVIEGPYPNVLDLLPTQYPTQLRLNRQELLQAADRAALLADSRLTARLIVLELEPDRLIITSQDPEVGQAYEEVAAELSGDGLRIGLNARYLADGLEHIASDEVLLEFIDPVKAIRIRGLADDSYEYIVFPVRL